MQSTATWQNWLVVSGLAAVLGVLWKIGLSALIAIIAVLVLGHDGKIGETREYVFTEWDPTAASDLDALRAVFDSNGDGKLTAADAKFASFKVMVTNADGSLTARTLTELGITEINLKGDATSMAQPDGSVITGQTTFRRADGSTGTVADTVLVAEAQGRRVVQTESRDAAGTRTVVSKNYDAGGTLVSVLTAVISANTVAWIAELVKCPATTRHPARAQPTKSTHGGWCP